MAGAYVQTYSNSNDGASNTSLTVTVGSATANNVLVAIVALRIASEAITTPSGWNLIISEASTNPSCGVYWRTADGTSADNFDPSWTNGGKCSAVVQEFSGLAVSTAHEDAGEDSSADGRSSCGTGTATPGTSDGMAIAALGVRDCADWATDAAGAGISIDNSFANAVYLASAASATSPLAGLASVAYTSTADQSATWTGDGGTTRCYGAIAVFKEPAAGGLAGIRNPMGGPMVLRNPLGRM